MKTVRRVQRMMDKVEGVRFCSLNAYLFNSSITIHKHRCRGICCNFCPKTCGSRSCEGRNRMLRCQHAKATFEEAFRVYGNNELVNGGTPDG